MAKKVQNTAPNSSAHSKEEGPRSAAYFERGIRDSRDTINMSLAVCGDMVTGRLSNAIGTAVAANVRNVIKMAELAIKFGSGEGGQKSLPLA